MAKSGMRVRNVENGLRNVMWWRITWQATAVCVRFVVSSATNAIRARQTFCDTFVSHIKTNETMRATNAAKVSRSWQFCDSIAASTQLNGISNVKFVTKCSKSRSIWNHISNDICRKPIGRSESTNLQRKSTNQDLRHAFARNAESSRTPLHCIWVTWSEFASLFSSFVWTIKNPFLLICFSEHTLASDHTNVRIVARNFRSNSHCGIISICTLARKSSNATHAAWHFVKLDI